MAVIESHVVEVEVPAVEVCLWNGEQGPASDETFGRPDDNIVEAAVQDLVSRHYDEVVDLCTERYKDWLDERAALAEVA